MATAAAAAFREIADDECCEENGDLEEKEKFRRPVG
jgi:hypothetical protein